MPWKVVAIKNGRQIISTSTFHDRQLAEGYAAQARFTGAQEARVVFVDDVQAHNLKHRVSL